MVDEPTHGFYRRAFTFAVSEAHEIQKND